jgi:hypothetical protein
MGLVEGAMDLRESWERESEALEAAGGPRETYDRAACRRNVLLYLIRRAGGDRLPARREERPAERNPVGPAWFLLRVDLGSFSLSLRLACASVILGWILVLGFQG